MLIDVMALQAPSYISVASYLLFMNDTNIWASANNVSRGLVVITPDIQADDQVTMGSNPTTAKVRLK